MRNAGLLEDFRRALPDFSRGGQRRLARTACAATSSTSTSAGRRAWPRRDASSRERGLRLILDFVPNHVAPDHPWVGEHPEYFVQGNADDLRRRSGVVRRGRRQRCSRCGRDPYFPAWPDVLQLNAFHPGLRQAAIETISEIAEQCDGIRCDMAMLMLNDDLRAHLGRPRRSQAGRRLLGDGDPGDRRRSIRSSGSSPRPTGTSSGSCSSRGSTTATTRSSTTGWSTATPRASACTSWPIAAYQEQDGPVHREPRRAQGRRRRSRRQGRARPPSRSSRSRARSCCTRGSSRAGRCGCPSSWAAARPSRSITTSRPSTSACSRRLSRDVFRQRRMAPLRAERLARQPELPERPRLVLGQGRRALPRRHQFRADSRPGARPRAVGRAARKARGASTTRCRVTSTTGAATRCGTPACTSTWRRGSATFSG